MNFYERTAKYYDIRHNSPSTKHLRSWEKKIIKKYTFGKVLDVGSGTGYHLNFLKSLGIDAIGIDNSKEMIKYSRHKTVLVDADNMPFKESSFDSVICMNSTLNLLNEKTIIEICKTLKPNGILIVSVSSIWDKKCPSFLEKLKKKKIENHMKAKSVMIDKSRLDMKLFKKEDLIYIMRRQGFSLIDFYGLFVFQRPYWGRFQSSLMEKGKLQLDILQLFKDLGTMYIMVFQKSLNYK